MAALPAWKQPEDEERKGSYTFGVVLNPGGGLAGEASVRISDFRCGKGAGGRWFRGGRSELRAAAECGLRETTGNAFYERPTAWGRTGVSVTVRRKPARDAGKAGWPVFGRRRVETSTEGQLYCAPKAREGLLRAVYLRVKSSGQTRNSASSPTDNPVVALGARLRCWEGRQGRAAAVLEAGLTTPFARVELDAVRTFSGAAGEQAGEGAGAKTEVRASVRTICALAQPYAPEPPPDELYRLGGQDIRGFSAEGLQPASLKDPGCVLPAMSVACLSISRLVPLNPTFGLLLFLDAGAASGAGEPAGSSSVPVRRSPLGLSWSTPVCSSVGYGLYLTAAPHIRAGLAWPFDKRLAHAPTTQRFFLCAQGDL